MSDEQQKTAQTSATGTQPPLIQLHTDNRALWVIVLILGLFLFVNFIFVFGILSLAGGSDKTSLNDIGVVEIKGTIENADSTIHAIREMNLDKSVKAILIRLNTPGGSVSASQEMVEAIRTIKKPVAISMGDMAASGGFYVACAGPRIFANPGTLTGSIGVISQLTDVSELLDFLNVKVNTVKTGSLKDAGSPFREFSREDRAYFEKMGLEIYEQFLDHVSTARNVPREKLLPIADGRVLSGRQALEAGLVDELGGMNAAITYLQKEAGLDDFNIVYPPESSRDMLRALLAEGSAEAGKSVIAAGVDALQQRTASFQYLYRP